jgi:Arc/MetJ-type ribon-helix-helix transcriptional regulator
MTERRVVKRDIGIGSGDDWDAMRETLAEHGVDIDACGDEVSSGDPVRVKVVCVTPDLKDSVEELGKSPRGQVVMVRVDEETIQDLDAWVESGAVKSRSEAAALFIREGLKVRASELEKLRGALQDVERARIRLREKAREVFGERDED